jgi:enoyl-CoA hydratase/carnithine racemase
MSAPEILLEKRADRIAVLTLNRPEVMNCIDRAMTRALRAAIADVEADDAVDVIVITGAGERAFCAGVDLKERQALSDEEASVYRSTQLFPMYRELDARHKPAIAAVFGHTLAGGFELALACDLIVAAEGASFGLPEVKWGLIPAAGGCRKLPALIGAARAKELILTAKTISAEEALHLGVINKVVPRGEQVQAALSLARQIIQNKQPAVRGAKRCIDEGVDARAACRFDVGVSNTCYASKERKAGVQSWKK